MEDTPRKPNGAETFICPWWLMYFFDNPLRQLLQPAARILQPLVAPGYTCLDVGCGMGYFTVPLAQLVGPTGRVTAVDLQAKMLEGAARRAQRHGVTGTISLCRPEDPEWTTPQKYDFVLAFWMLHEVPDRRSFLATLRSVLKTSRCLLLVEPRLHVRKQQWEESLALAEAVGLASRMGPPVTLSRTAILE
jgi:2-polyprenyl-3-methyl-5-hydroxy-6-metoxy-1,4-benzoquinol methylase